LGVWYFGYGLGADETTVKAPPAGSFYSEPAGVVQFAETGAHPAVVYITGLARLTRYTSNPATIRAEIAIMQIQFLKRIIQMTSSKSVRNPATDSPLTP
jgi:hypothetical protein